MVFIVGTSSSCGKSTVALCICRHLRRLGYKVAPFKAQNMSLNSYVTRFGEEIAFIQHVQAIACEVDSTSLMNPILLKPVDHDATEIVVMGRPHAVVRPGSYFTSDRAYSLLLDVVRMSYASLRRAFDVVVAEGAGSCAEPNLLDRDLANLRIAFEFKAPALLVVDIDRGGAFASAIGTLEILPRRYRELIRGFVINKFRGDAKILEPAIRWLESRTGRRVVGVVPYDDVFKLFPEDSMDLEDWHGGNVNISVIAYPGISNFNEIHMLKLIPDVTIRYVRRPEELVDPDVIVLPGTRNVFRAMEYLRSTELDKKIIKLLGSAIIIGICGGFQIISRRVVDETGLECGVPAHANGLGLLDVEFRYARDKLISRTSGVVVSDLTDEILVEGYEIRRGRHLYLGRPRPFVKVVKRNQQIAADLDGCVDERNLVVGTNIHEILLNAELLRQLLRHVGKSVSTVDLKEMIVERMDVMRDEFKRHVDVDYIEELATSTAR